MKLITLKFMHMGTTLYRLSSSDFSSYWRNLKSPYSHRMVISTLSAGHIRYHSQPNLLGKVRSNHGDLNIKPGRKLSNALPHLILVECGKLNLGYTLSAAIPHHTSGQIC